jgi:hypothetical protein
VVLFGLFAVKSRTCQFGGGNGELRWGCERGGTFEESPFYDVGEGLFSRQRGKMAGWREVEKR